MKIVEKMTLRLSGTPPLFRKNALCEEVRTLSLITTDTPAVSRKTEMCAIKGDKSGMEK